jgi:SNF2 family DNA or RNA helicase
VSDAGAVLRWRISPLTPYLSLPQNNVEELFSLFQFLRARPFDDWQVFRERIAAPVKEGRTKMAMKRLHVSDHEEAPRRPSSFLRDRQVVLKSIMLRRRKDAKIGAQAPLPRQGLSGLPSFLLSDGKPILNLPARNVDVVQCPFDADERSFYDALEAKTTLKFNKVSRETPVD